MHQNCTSRTTRGSPFQAGTVHHFYVYVYLCEWEQFVAGMYRVKKEGCFLLEGDLLPLEQQENKLMPTLGVTISSCQMLIKPCVAVQASTNFNGLYLSQT